MILGNIDYVSTMKMLQEDSNLLTLGLAIPILDNIFRYPVIGLDQSRAKDFVLENIDIYLADKYNTNRHFVNKLVALYVDNVLKIEEICHIIKSQTFNVREPRAVPMDVAMTRKLFYKSTIFSKN